MSACLVEKQSNNMDSCSRKSKKCSYKAVKMLLSLATLAEIFLEGTAERAELQHERTL